MLSFVSCFIIPVAPRSVEASDVMVPEYLLPCALRGHGKILQGPDQPLAQAVRAVRGEGRRPVRADPEEGAELGVEAVEDDRAVPRLLLPYGEAGEVRR